jgi:hypothetical protein
VDALARTLSKPSSYAAAVALVAALYPPDHASDAPSMDDLITVPFDEQLVASVPPLVLAGKLQLPPGYHSASSQAYWNRMHDRCVGRPSVVGCGVCRVPCGVWAVG